jgi:AcrR family transcriptional regulator
MPKSKQDWLKSGLDNLADAGVMGLTIDLLADDLSLTKGSFYHHFRNVEDFQHQLVSFWAEQFLSTSLLVPENPEELLALLDQVIREAYGYVTGPEIAIRVWAQEDDYVRSVVERVDGARSGFIFKVFNSVTEDESRAHIMTELLSTMLIGSMTIIPRIPPERVQQLYQEFKRVYSL